MTEDIEAARAKVAELVKFDILTNTQSEDNASQARDVARCFICE